MDSRLDSLITNIYWELRSSDPKVTADQPVARLRSLGDPIEQIAKLIQVTNHLLEDSKNYLYEAIEFILSNQEHAGDRMITDAVTTCQFLTESDDSSEVKGPKMAVFRLLMQTFQTLAEEQSYNNVLELQRISQSIQNLILGNGYDRAALVHYKDYESVLKVSQLGLRYPFEAIGPSLIKTALFVWPRNSNREPITIPESGDSAKDYRDLLADYVRLIAVKLHTNCLAMEDSCRISLIYSLVCALKIDFELVFQVMESIEGHEFAATDALSKYLDIWIKDIGTNAFISQIDAIISCRALLRIINTHRGRRPAIFMSFARHFVPCLVKILFRLMERDQRLGLNNTDKKILEPYDRVIPSLLLKFFNLPKTDDPDWLHLLFIDFDRGTLQSRCYHIIEYAFCKLLKPGDRQAYESGSRNQVTMWDSYVKRVMAYRRTGTISNLNNNNFSLKSLVTRLSDPEVMTPKKRRT